LLPWSSFKSASKAAVVVRPTATAAHELVKAAKAETTELRASLGLHSNNPPAEENQ
jgi:hypothetical protein